MKLIGVPGLMMAGVCATVAVTDRAVASDGRVYAWGAGTSVSTTPNLGQSMVPHGLNNVEMVAAGALHTLALRADGTVVAWGHNEWGNCDVPRDLRDVVKVQAGDWFSLALLTDGTIRSWGQGWFGSLPPNGLAGVRDITATWLVSALTMADGTVQCYGYNHYGTVQVPSDLSQVRQVALSVQRAFAVRIDGSVRVWGSGGADPPATLPPVTKIAAAETHAVALDPAGRLHCWGGGQWNWVYCNIPADLPRAVDLVAGGDRVLTLLEDGTVRAFGGNNSFDVLTSPPGLADVMNIAAGTNHHVTAVCRSELEILSTPNLGRFGFGTPVEYVIQSPPITADGPVSVVVRASGDLDLPTEFLTVRVNDVPVGVVFVGPAPNSDCATVLRLDALSISEMTYETLAASGQLTIKVEASAGVNASQCSNPFLSVQLEIPTQRADCNSNGRDDRCDIALDPTLDCDGDGVLDACDRTVPTLDCDGSGTADACEIVSNPFLDCDEDGQIDACQISSSPVLDCNSNGRLDSCDLDLGALDKDGDGQIDWCELAYGDFDLSGTIDGVDLASLLAVWGLATPPYGDLNGDGIVGGPDLAFLLARWGPLP